MSDMVKRLRDAGKEASPRGELMWKAADRIYQLERELAAEKALADRLYGACQGWVPMGDALSSYRKERWL